MTATSGKNKGRERAKRTQTESCRNNSRLLPALIAGSACSLVSGPASALQLGDLDVQSALGQPLRASIAFALSPNEQLFSYCMSLKPGVSADGLPMLNSAKLSIANGSILLTGTSALREPMLAMQVAISCPYTANLTRSYTIMLDPAKPAAAVSERPIETLVKPILANPVSPRSRPAVKPNVARERPSARVNVNTDPIPLSTQYIVKSGDTLSEIASRIENRPIGLWVAVNIIFDGNPGAFINGDVNRLKAGSQLTIPAFDDVNAPALASIDVTPAPATVEAEAIAETSDVYSGYAPDEPATQPVDDLVDHVPVSEPAPLAASDIAPTAEIPPVDIAIDGGTSLVSPIEALGESEDLQPVVVADPMVGQTAPATDVVASSPTTDTSRKTSDDWSWMFWLAGSGMALILGLLLFGRRIRDRFGSIAIGTDVDRTIGDDEDTAHNQALSEVHLQYRNSNQEVAPGADSAPDTDLNDSEGFEVTQAMGSSSDSDAGADLGKLPKEAADQEGDANATDIMQLHRNGKSSILDDEILSGDNDETSMSKILDISKQGSSDNSPTEKDLKALPDDNESVADATVECTLNDEFGLDTLQQDYEDELTATQVANLEIEKAAADLALHLDEPFDDKTAEMQAADTTDESVDGNTAEIPVADNADETMGVKTTEMPMDDFAVEATSEMTVQMPETARAENDEFSDPDSTGLQDEVTAQMPAAENDATTNKEVESGRVNTRKSAG